MAMRSEMGLDRFTRASDPTEEATLALVTERRKRLRRVSSEAASIAERCQQTYELLTQVREPSVAEKKALEKRIPGVVFLSLPSRALPQVIIEDPDYFWDGELNYVSARPQFRDFIIPAMEVAINPTPLALPDSFGKSRPEQILMIDDYSKEQIETEFPNAKAIMLPAVGYVLADKIYKKRTGEVLFRNFFVRALDNTREVDAADVGRYRPNDPFRVRDWSVVGGDKHVGAVPAVVFLRK